MRIRLNAQQKQDFAVAIQTQTPLGAFPQAANALRILPEGATVDEVVRGLRAIGVSARDTISILQAIKSAGALNAELEMQ